MHDTTPVLQLVCGKIAAGKSTLVAQLAEAPDRVRISEDDWLFVLFGDQLQTGADFMRFSAKLEGVMGPHVAHLLAAGVSVVLDFPANTPDQRRWMREVIDQSGAAHQMHLLDPPDAVCLQRLQARNAVGTHPFAVTEAQFHRFTAHFSPPAPEEGFTIVHHPA